jgi:plasmid stabilization system protein ParE
MSFQVVTSRRAEKNLADIISYLESKWSVRTANKFLHLANKKVKQIAINPEMYELSNKKGIRRCVLTKQTIMYYRIKTREKEIEIVTFQDSRKNPKKLKL